MSERESWMPSDDEINAACNEDDSPNYVPGEPSFVTTAPLVRAFVRTAVERALAAQEARHKREVIEALIYELDNATSTVCQGCAEGIDYWPADGSHRRQISDDGDCEGGPCNCHELSDRLHGLRAELAALEEEADDAR